MKKERLLILLGTLVALIFFYVGLNKWLESKPESAPPSVVVRPTHKQPIQPASPPQEEKAKEEPKAEEKKQTPPPEPRKPKEDLIAQKVQEEKNKEEKTKEVQKTQEVKQLTAQKQKTQKEGEKVEKVKEEKIQKSTKEVQKTQEVKQLTAQKQKTRKESEKVGRVKEEKIQKSTVAKQEKQAKKPKGEVKEYVIQIGAFGSKENAKKALEKAKSMGYKGEIVSKDKFYSVRVRVKTDDPKKILAKLRSAFGDAIIKQ